MPPFLYTCITEQDKWQTGEKEGIIVKYVLLVSHGMFAPGLHSALDMLAGEGRKDILSVSLENGMGSDVYADNVKKCLEVVGPEDEILLFGDLVGGSPLTTAANVIAEQKLLERTVMMGGMSLPLALSAVLMKDAMELRELPGMLLPEAREELKEFTITGEDSEEDI